MKKTSLFNFLLFALFFAGRAIAQNVSPEVAAQFSPGVLTQVYGVASKVSLSAGKQKAIAILIHKQDSLLADMIKNGASPLAIDSIQARKTTIINMILTPKELNDYYNAKLEQDAKTEGRLMGKLLQQKYDLDNSLQNILSDIYYRRKLEVDKSFTSIPDSGVLEQQLNTLLVKFDTLIEKYTHTAASNAFIKDKIATLNAIKPLNEKEEKSITNHFLGLCTKFPKRSFADNFDFALHSIITDTLYYATLYKEEIGKKAAANGNISARYLVSKNKITKEGLNEILPLVFEKERKLAVLNTTYPFYTKAKDNLAAGIHARYDSLIDAALLRDGSTLPNSQFAIAVQYRKSLGLSNIQLDSLLTQASNLKKMKDEFLKNDPLGKYDSKAFETENMTRILTEDQYSKVLIIKNRSQAKSEAEQDWKEIEQRGLATEYNKDSTISQLNNYYLAKWCAYYRYGNDKIKQTANVKSIEENAPRALRALKAARKYNNPTTPAQGNYQW